MLEPLTLHDDRVRLEPLTPEHAPALELAAADGDLGSLTYTSVPAPGQADRYVASALAGAAAGHMLPFAVVDLASGRVVGSTRYYEIDLAVPRLAIGYTWYAQSFHRTYVNRACKRLLLRHAFETLGCAAVAFHTDVLNVRSQRAIEALGAVKEGVLRAHKRRADGSLRDTVCYSILASEWPAVEARLVRRG